jgi:hypothetical protein
MPDPGMNTPPENPDETPVGEAVVRAIFAHQIISFDYGGGRRTVEPHLLGLQEAGEVTLVAYQIEGFSASGTLPGWRTFFLSEIDQLHTENRTFAVTRPRFAPNAHQMVEIFARA